MSSPASVAAPVAAPTAPDTSAAPTTPAAPAAPVDAEAAHEAEYRAALAKARGETAPKKRDDSGRFQKAEGEGDDVEGDETDDQVEASEEEDGQVADGETADDADEGEEKPEAKAEKKPKPEIEKFKVNGREVEVDVSDKAKVRTLIQKGLAGDEAMAKSAKVTKQAEAFIAALRDNAIGVLTNPKLGVDQKNLRAALEKHLYELVKFETATPEEQNAIKERQELERYREQQQKVESAKKAQERTKAKEAYQRDITPKFIEAIEAAELPATDFTLFQMTRYMRAARARGMKTITPADVAPLVRRDYEKAQRQLFSRYDGEELIKRVGEEHAEKVVKAKLEKVAPAKTATPRRDAAPRPEKKSQAPKAPAFSSAEEMRDYVMNQRR